MLRRTTYSRFTRALAGVWLLGLFAPLAGAQDTPQPQLAAVSFRVNYHTFRSDRDFRFQLGTPPVEPFLDFIAGVRRDKTPFGGGSAGLYRQELRLRELPGAFVAAARERGIPLDNVSLRLQHAWQLGAGLYPVRDLLAGYRLARDTFRLDDISRPAMTTIPYVRGKQLSHVAFARYTPAIKRLHLHLEGGLGRAGLNFVVGEERYLKNNDEGSVAKSSGLVTPFAVGAGVRVKRLGETGALFPFVQFEQTSTRAEATRITSRNFFFGIRVMF